MEDRTTRYSTIALFVTFLEATILAGSIFGWPSLVYVLQEYGLYESVCQRLSTSTNTTNSYNPLPHATSSSEILLPTQSTQYVQRYVGKDENSSPSRCLAQKVQLSKAYTTAIMSYGVCALPVGMFFDRFGLRATRTIVVTIGITTQLLLAFVTPGKEWMIMIAAVCAGISCFGFYMTVCHLALLAGRRASTALGIFIAGVDTSFAYTVVKILNDHGVTPMITLSAVAACWFLALISTWTILPKYKVCYSEKEQTADQSEKPESAEDNYKNEYTDPSETSSNSGDSGLCRSTEDIPRINSYQTFENLQGLDQARKNDDNGSKSVLMEVYMSLEFFLFVYWFCVNHLRVNMMNNEFDAWVSEVVHDNTDKVSFYTNILAYANIVAVIPSPIIGFVTDSMRAKYGHLLGGNDLSLVPMVSVTVLINIILTMILFIKSEASIWAVIALFAMSKPIFYSTASSFMGFIYPTEYFGIIYGTAYLLGGLTSLMMYPYFSWISATQSFSPVNWLIMATVLLSLSLPMKLYFNWRKHTSLNNTEKKTLVTPSGFGS